MALGLILVPERNLGMRLHVATVEYVSSVHGQGTLGCSGRGGLALNTYSSAHDM